MASNAGLSQPRILIVGSQHGDERLGARLQRHIQKYPDRYKSVDYLCGNPRAYRQNVRFIQTDLNRSYNPAGGIAKTYEERRAQRILDHIRSGSYDYVFDVHTSNTDVNRFLLAANTDEAVQAIIGASTIERLVVMPPHIADCSLIGQVPQAVSIEYNKSLAQTPQALGEVVRLLDNLLDEQTVLGRQREIFMVRDKIPLDIALAEGTPNFQLCEYGFYPVLIGPNNYKTYKGFAAYDRNVLML